MDIKLDCAKCKRVEPMTCVSLGEHMGYAWVCDTCHLQRGSAEDLEIRARADWVRDRKKKETSRG